MKKPRTMAGLGLNDCAEGRWVRLTLARAISRPCQRGGPLLRGYMGRRSPRAVQHLRDGWG